jgi:hypothetical protein
VAGVLVLRDAKDAEALGELRNAEVLAVPCPRE